jgi:hypothetical protein
VRLRKKASRSRNTPENPMISVNVIKSYCAVNVKCTEFQGKQIRFKLMILLFFKRNFFGNSLLDSGCWMLDAGCWMLDAGI